MSRIEDAVRRFEERHREDPRSAGGRAATYSLWYHQRLAAWVLRLAPDASEALRLAAACQHIGRWELPRAAFPEGLAGYKRWRSELARRHATEAEEILRAVGYDESVVGRVRALLMKKGLKADPEVQLFEDAICLTFLENELEEFAAKHDEPKLASILAKTWAKMSPAGHRLALDLCAGLPEGVRAVVLRAVA
jgi:hypothetical protein